MNALVDRPSTPILCTARPRVLLRSLFVLLCGLVAIGSLLGTSSPTQASPHPIEYRSAEPSRSPLPWTQGSAGQPSQEATAGPEQESPADTARFEPEGEESFVENVLEVLIFGPIFAILLGLLLSFPSVLLGVSLVMDGGCFRYLLFGVGWLFAVFYGLLAGALVAEEILGLEFLMKPIFYIFMWGYPFAAYWGHQKLQSMPKEQYRAWEQTLTGGALLGFGAGSIAGLLRSAASGFGGFGGGSFGGGGASGSWSGASSTAAGSAPDAAGGTSAGVAGSGTTAAGSAAKAATVAGGVAPGVAGANGSSESAAETSPSTGLLSRFGQWLKKFQWYHGLIFILATFVFLPLGLGTMRALQNTKFFVFVLVFVIGYSGYRLLRRNPDSVQSLVRSISSFSGGNATGSWS